MRILLTGSSGVVGSDVLSYLLKEGHSIIAVDQITLPQSILSSFSSQYPNLDEILEVQTVDLSSIKAVRSLFSKYPSSGDKKLDGIIHLAAIPTPDKDDPRLVHNTNTSISYNILYTAAEKGISRIVQASSVNFTGLAYTRKGLQKFDKLPITEEEPSHAEDPYALSKQICEIQATSICRLFPVRITSLRFHHVLETLEEALNWSREEEFWTWTSSLAASQACLLGLTSENWEGHEAFNIVADDIAWNRGLYTSINGDARENRDKAENKKVGSLELLENSQWIKGGNRIGKVNKEWWDGNGNERKGFWNCDKAKKLLGWQHNV